MPADGRRRVLQRAEAGGSGAGWWERYGVCWFEQRGEYFGDDCGQQ
ncbi:MAG: hypothetical protein JF587_06100 [Catenulisporales bacterium]|nr:hypothetical protein [Catenulisporales bacterium]